MVMSYHRILGDHLADPLIYLSSSSSFWFSLNSSYKHDFHLSKRLGMTPKDYEYLLVAADLAHIDKRWGFSIKMMKWRLFLEGHWFTTINCDGTFEVDVKKVDLNAFIQGESAMHREMVNFILVVASPLVALSFRPLLVHHAGWLLRRLSSRRRLDFSSHRTLVLLSSYHCAALSSSHRVVWLLFRPSSHCCLFLSLSSHSQRDSRCPRRWRLLSPAAPDVEFCRRCGPRHRVTVALNIALDAVSCPPTL